MRIITFDFSVDILQHLLWQYNEASNIQGLLTKKSEWYEKNYTDFWDDWIRDVFDLRTAMEFGFSVWARILDIPLYEGSPRSGPDYPVFGFGRIGHGFDEGSFGTIGGRFNRLTLEERRAILRLRYFSLVTSGNVGEINQFLNEVFGPNVAKCTDNLNMTLTYTFLKQQTPNFISALQELDVLPRPSGVSITHREVEREGIFSQISSYTFTLGGFGSFAQIQMDFTVDRDNTPIIWDASDFSFKVEPHYKELVNFRVTGNVSTEEGNNFDFLLVRNNDTANPIKSQTLEINQPDVVQTFEFEVQFEANSNDLLSFWATGSQFASIITFSNVIVEFATRDG